MVLKGVLKDGNLLFFLSINNLIVLIVGHELFFLTNKSITTKMVEVLQIEVTPECKMFVSIMKKYMGTIITYQR